VRVKTHQAIMGEAFDPRAPMWLTAIDPGATKGWATFTRGRLFACGLGGHAIPPGLVVIERPVYRPGARVDPNDLVTLAIRVGEDKAAAERAGCTVELVEPHMWKGSVPKAIHHRRLLAALTSDERAVFDSAPGTKTQKGNTLDAVGIGLWRLGRASPAAKAHIARVLRGLADKLDGGEEPTGAAAPTLPPDVRPRPGEYDPRY